MDKFVITPEIKKKIDEDMDKYRIKFEEACDLYGKYIKCFSNAYLSGSDLYVGDKLYYNNETLYKNMNVISFFINNKDEIKEFIFKYELDEFLGNNRQFV
tara:strand:+ start:461 stop:760 length:300 start_codon:yes stop_codon:yes gene_type:complete